MLSHQARRTERAAKRAAGLRRDAESAPGPARNQHRFDLFAVAKGPEEFPGAVLRLLDHIRGESGQRELLLELFAKRLGQLGRVAPGRHRGDPETAKQLCRPIGRQPFCLDPAIELNGGLSRGEVENRTSRIHPGESNHSAYLDVHSSVTTPDLQYHVNLGRPAGGPFALLFRQATVTLFRPRSPRAAPDRPPIAGPYFAPHTPLWFPHPRRRRPNRPPRRVDSSSPRSWRHRLSRPARSRRAGATVMRPAVDSGRNDGGSSGGVARDRRAR